MTEGRTRAALGLALAACLVTSADAQGTTEVASSPAVSLPLPEEVRLEDLPNDNGTGLVLFWSRDPQAPPSMVYRAEVGLAPEGPFYPAGVVPASAPLASEAPKVFGIWRNYGDRQYLIVTSYMVPPDTVGGAPRTVMLEPGKRYYVRFSVADGGVQATLANVLVGEPKQNLFNWSKLNNLAFGVFFGAVILFFIWLARRNPNLYIRKIAGLDAVEESLGRATEMGKPVYFIHGLDGMSSVSTIASVNILRPIARRTAQYDTELKVMNMDPIVQAVSQEVVREGCIDVGRPDAYNEEDVMFVADRQFSYAAAVDGLMVRETPATVILMGYFYAESLLFTETGNQIGAIQIAGTDAYTQLPFFITTCDYTLMGEELYAASAYLSREPKLLGSLRGQDVGKLLILGVLTIGTVLELIGVHWLSRLVMPL